MGVPYAEVIGDPIAHSKSPADPQILAGEAGHRGRLSRRRASRPTSSPAYLAARRADPDWRGCNVTMPHKQAVLAAARRARSDRAQIGAVNTRRAATTDALIGTNTDWRRVIDAPLARMLDSTGEHASA